MDITHPFRIVISGKSGKGKTTTLINLLVRDDIIDETFDELYIICPTFWTDNNYRIIKKNESTFIFNTYNEEVIEKIIKESSKNNSKKKMIVLDDILGETIKKGGVSTYQTQINKLLGNARHYNISVILSVQNIGQLNDGVLHNTDILIFYPTINELEFKKVKEKFAGNMTLPTFRKLCKFAWEDNSRNFLLINNHYKLNEPIYYKNFNKIIIDNKKFNVESESDTDSNTSSDTDFYYSESD